MAEAPKHRWEYRIEIVDLGSQMRHEDLLEQRGQDRWELVSVLALPSRQDTQLRYYFKRPVVELSSDELFQDWKADSD